MKTSVWMIVIGVILGLLGVVFWPFLLLGPLLIIVGIIMFLGAGTAKAAKAGYKVASGDKTGTGRL